MQKDLRSSSTASQLVDEWGGTLAQLNCNIMLHEASNSDTIPTISCVCASFDNSTATRIITRHLESILQFSGITDFEPLQLAETALSIMTNYYFLNLAELCIFFSQIKAGARGQFIWGTKVNNQAIMVALAGFCRERSLEIDKFRRQEADRRRQELESFKGISRAEAEVLTQKAKECIEGFKELFPHIPSDEEIWWRAWKGDSNAINIVYSYFGIQKSPPIDIAMSEIRFYLGRYNSQKENEF